MDRAYSILDVKGQSEDEKYIFVEGIASTPTVDRDGDSIDPMGAKFATPMPLLWQHRHDSPVGNITFAEPTAKGIPFKARIPKVTEPGVLKDRIDEAVQSMKYGLIKAVSIGFKILEDGYELRDGGGYDIKNWEWLELSLVTIPANSEAVLSSVKSADLETLSALGLREKPVDNSAPGDTGQKAARRPIQLIPRK